MLSDKNIASECLATQKFICNQYNSAILESDGSLRRDLLDIYEQEQFLAEKIYQTMSQKGWYKTQPADAQQMSQVRQTLQQEMNQVLGMTKAPGGIHQQVVQDLTT